MDRKSNKQAPPTVKGPPAEKGSLLDFFNRANHKKPDSILPTSLAKCGVERREPKHRGGYPLAEVPDWVLDNDFGGTVATPPNEDMDRLDKEIRAVTAEIESLGGAKTENTGLELEAQFVSFWKEMLNVALPVFDEKKMQK